MRSHVLLALALLAAASRAHAQMERVTTAFAPSFTPWIGLAVHGTRVTGAGASFSYSNSAAAGVRADRPLTRRVGMMASVGIAPFGKQKAAGGDQTILGSSVFVISGDVGLAARLKPAVPVFFFVGGGASLASRGTFSDAASFAPQGTVAIGYDAGRRDRASARVTWVGHLVFPPDPGVAGYTSKSAVFEWAIEIGMRIPIRRGASATPAAR